MSKEEPLHSEFIFKQTDEDHEELASRDRVSDELWVSTALGLGVQDLWPPSKQDRSQSFMSPAPTSTSSQ